MSDLDDIAALRIDQAALDKPVTVDECLEQIQQLRSQLIDLLVRVKDFLGQYDIMHCPIAFEVNALRNEVEQQINKAQLNPCRSSREQVEK